MAYQEYFDLYLSAQNNPEAPYYVVSFDTVNSKIMTEEERAILQRNINIIVQYVYNKLCDSEDKLQKEVVIKDKRFIRPWDFKATNWNRTFIDPLIYGDTFQFTVLRDTISKEKIIEWVNTCMEHLCMEEDFHIADGYYETNEYNEGNTKFYRGYCLQTLESLHKPQTKNELQKIKNTNN